MKIIKTSDLEDSDRDKSTSSDLYNDKKSSLDIKLKLKTVYYTKQKGKKENQSENSKFRFFSIALN